MKFKIKVECEHSVSKKEAMEWIGTTDLRVVTKRLERSLRREVFDQPFLKKMKVIVRPTSRSSIVG
jgi:hypothetical protein